jgi:hypothetical protein
VKQEEMRALEKGVVFAKTLNNIRAKRAKISSKYERFRKN